MSKDGMRVNNNLVECSSLVLLSQNQILSVDLSILFFTHPNHCPTTGISKAVVYAVRSVRNSISKIP